MSAMNSSPAMSRSARRAGEAAVAGLAGAGVTRPLHHAAAAHVSAAPYRAGRQLPRCRRKLTNSTPSRSRRFIMSGLRSISADISAIFPARK